MNVFNKLFEENAKIIDKQPTESPKFSHMSNIHSTPIEKFKIALSDAEEYVKQNGRPLLEEYGRCGKSIVDSSSKKTRNTWIRKSKQARKKGMYTDDDIAYLEDLVQNKGFMDKICLLDKGHKGKCTANPFLPNQNKKDPIVSGIILKLKDPLTNPGDDPKKGANRSHARNFPMPLDHGSRAVWYGVNKSSGFEKENKNLFMRLAMMAHPVQMATGYMDIYTAISHVERIDSYLPDNRSTAWVDMCEKNWPTMIELNQKRKLYISSIDGFLQDWCTHEKITPEQFGRGGDGKDLLGIQFGHIMSIREDSWQTKSGNVLPITRGTNLLQSSADAHDVFKKMERWIHKQKEREALDNEK